MKAPSRRSYSYREDWTVPTFADDRPLIVFDNVCVLCSGFVQWVVARDRRERLRFTPAQGPLGQALYRHYGLPTETFETNLLLADGVLYGKSDAFFEITRRLDGPWPLLNIGRLAPRALRDRLYDRIARNRYRLFGRRETCWLPTPEIARRVL